MWLTKGTHWAALRRRWSTGNSATGTNRFHRIRCNSVKILALYRDENFMALNFPRPSVLTLRLNSFEFTSRPRTGEAPSKSVATSYEFVTVSVEGSRVRTEMMEVPPPPLGFREAESDLSPRWQKPPDLRRRLPRCLRCIEGCCLNWNVRERLGTNLERQKRRKEKI